MRIAVIHNLPPGGAKRALVEWTRRLSERHEIDLFTYTRLNNEDEALKPHLNRHWKIADLPFSSGSGPLNKGYHFLGMKRIAEKLASHIRPDSYDVAFVHQCAFFQNPPVLALLELPTVFYSQDTPQRTLYEPGLFSPRPRRLRIAEWLKDRENRAAIQAADRVLTSSYYTREALEKIYGIRAEVVYFGIDVEKFRPTGVPKSDFLLSVGRLHPTKGHDFVIQSLGRIEPSLRPRLKIVCEAEKPHEIAALCSLAKENDVLLEFEISVDDGRLIHLYNQALLTVCAYRMEPLGFVILESLACGTPVVGVREAGLRETVKDDVVGLLADRHPEKMAGALAALLKDPAKRATFSKNAIDHIRRSWTIEKSVAEIEKYLIRTKEESA